MAASADIFAPLDQAFVQDPYSGYDRLRASDPVHQTSAGYWVLTRYRDVAAGLRDRRLSNRPAPLALVNRRNAGRYVAASVANNLVAFQDPPEHTAPRKLLATQLKAHVNGFEAGIGEIAGDLLSGLRGRTTIEFMQDFSVPFACRGICQVMGFPESDVPLLKQWSSLFFYLFHSIPNAEVLDRVNSALAEFRQYVGDAIAERRLRPRADLLTTLAQAKRGDFAFGESELIDNCMLLTADGIENVQTGLATAVATLLAHRDQLERMTANPALIGPAIDECLRYESPGQYQGRIATETFEIDGRTIRANSVVLLGLAAANRDPEVFDEPDRFLIDRTGARHLAFGLGQHACIGGTLVEIEFRAALRALFDGSRELAATGGRQEWTSRAGHRWPVALPLEVRDL